MSELTSSEFELRAAKERLRLQESLDELKDSVHDRLDIKRNLQGHLVLISGIVGVAAIFLGFGFGGVFSRRKFN